MREIRIEARLRNNILCHVIFDKFKSVAAFCRMYKLSQAMIGDMLNLKYCPIKKNGSYTKNCEKVAKIFKLTPDMLFPLALYKIKQPKRFWEISFSQLPSSDLKQLPAPSDPESEIIEKEFKNALVKALSTLSPREEQVIRMLYGLEGDEMTTIEVAEQFHVCRSRIMQIRDKALRKLRHPTRIGLSEHKFFDKN